MRAGKLDRVIVIQRATETLDPAGAPVVAWDPHITMRAQIIEANTEEFLRNYGEASEAIVIFRTRFMDDVTPADRVAYGGRHYNIKGIKELGRRNALELRTVAVGAP